MQIGCSYSPSAAYNYDLMGLIKADVGTRGENAVEICKAAAAKIESKLE